MAEISAPAVLTPRLTRLLSAALLAVFAFLLIASSRQEAQTFDESTCPADPVFRREQLRRSNRRSACDLEPYETLAAAKGLRRPLRGVGAALDLKSDGSMSVRDLPEELRTTSCTLSGAGKWSGPDEDQKLDLNVISDGSPGSCESGSYSFLELAEVVVQIRRAAPYSLPIKR